MPQTIDFNIPISSGKNSCFISYTREDAPRIARFVKALYNRYGYTFSGNRDTGIAAHEKCLIGTELSNKSALLLSLKTFVNII